MRGGSSRLRRRFRTELMSNENSKSQITKADIVEQTVYICGFNLPVVVDDEIRRTGGRPSTRRGRRRSGDVAIGGRRRCRRRFPHRDTDRGDRRTISARPSTAIGGKRLSVADHTVADGTDAAGNNDGATSVAKGRREIWYPTAFGQTPTLLLRQYLQRRSVGARTGCANIPREKRCIRMGTFAWAIRAEEHQGLCMYVLVL